MSETIVALDDRQKMQIMVNALHEKILDETFVPSWDEAEENCFYLDDKGHVCGIGLFMPRPFLEENHGWLEGKSASSVLSYIQHVQAKDMTTYQGDSEEEEELLPENAESWKEYDFSHFPNDSDMLNEFQGIHDKSAKFYHADHKAFRAYARDKLVDFCLRYELEVPGA